LALIDGASHPADLADGVPAAALLAIGLALFTFTG
jgi:hypothetical protein